MLETQPFQAGSIEDAIRVSEALQLLLTLGADQGCKLKGTWGSHTPQDPLAPHGGPLDPLQIGNAP